MGMNQAIEKIAKTLRVKPEALLDLEQKMNKATGKSGVLEKIGAYNEKIIKNHLESLGLKSDSPAKEVFSALIKKITLADRTFVEKFGGVSVANINDCQKVLDAIKDSQEKLIGFFLKKNKAAELLRKEPPMNIVRALGYRNIEEALVKEDIFELFAALRFIEDGDWLNNVFFKQYESLTPNDFEERGVEIKVLSRKWVKAAEGFVKKKYHNISHLKEFGAIFVIPVALNIPGELLRMVSLVMHYYHEVKFYSDIFRGFSGQADFAKNLIQTLKGSTIENKPAASEKAQWLVIQQYLAKKDENDWRLLSPHINPEAIHWRKAESGIVKLGQSLAGLQEGDFEFWEDLDWVGEYFPSGKNGTELVSFDLVDVVMSLVKEKEMVKYLYHQQEALWNKIFAEYFGEEKMEEIIKNNLLKGFVGV
jgi:hypothetical protein